MGLSPSYGPHHSRREVRIAMIRSAYALGMTFFDNAEVYGPYVT